MKKITFLIAYLLSMTIVGHAQVQIGTGTNPNSGVPFYPSNPYSYSQSIYLDEEIDASGNITSLQWQFTGVTELENSQNIDVYLGHTSKEEFGFQGDWIPYNNLTLVYSGGLEITESGWITLTFSTPFNYNGTDNLIVAVKENNPGFDSYLDGFYSTTFTGNRSILASSSSETNNPDPVNPPTTEYGYIQMPVPNVIFGGISQACPTAFYVTTSDISTTSATFTWQEPAVAPSDGSQYYISTENIAPTNSTEPTGTSASVNTAVAENLQPATTYYIWVRNKCGEDLFSAWSTVYTFVTTCLPGIEINENFDSVTAPAIPLCWSTIIRAHETASIETINSTTTPSQPNAVHLRNGNVSSPNDEIILVSPELSNLSAGTHRLKFNAHDMGGGGSAIDLQIVTLEDNSNDAGYTIFSTVETESSFFGTYYIVDFTLYEGTDKYIGFRLNATGWGSELIIDDIQWETIPPCPDVDVTGIIVPEISTSGATISWNADDISAWQIVHAPATVTNPNGLTPQDSDDTLVEITGLDSNTAYNVWVRSVCEEGNGVWIGPVTFRTSCDAITEFSENFDGVVTPALPECWTSIINPSTVGMGSASVGTIEFPSVSHSAPNSVSLYSGFEGLTENSNDVILVSPTLSNIGAGTHRLKFHGFSGGINGEIQVIILNTNTIYAEYTVVQNITLTDVVSEYIVDFSDFTDATKNYIGIRMNSTSTNSSSVYIDDMIWELAPPCPDVPFASMSVETVTNATALINWGPGGEENAWEIAYGPIAATDPNSQTIVTATDFDSETNTASKLLTELTPSTEYKLWIRSVCEGGNGFWKGPITFNTACLPVDSFDENFDTTPIQEMASCWSKILRGATLASYAVIETQVGAFHSAPNTVGMYKGDSGAEDDLILVSPELTNLNAGTHRLTFYGIVYNTAGALEIGTLNNASSSAEFTPLDNIVLTTTNEAYVVDFSGYEGTDTFIGIRLNSSAIHTAAYLDNIVWEAIPACPHISEMTVSAVTDTDALIDWPLGGSEVAWQIAYAVATVTSPDGITPVAVTGNPSTTLSGLQAGTQYHIWVRSVCGETFGTWYGPVTFLTDCTAVTEFSENLDTTTTPAMPACWNAIKRGTTLASNAVIETSSVGAQSAPNVMVIYKATSGENDDLIIVSPKISNAGAGTHRLTFNSMMQNGAGAELQIGTLDGYTNDAIFTAFENVSPTAAYQQFSIDFDGYNGTDEYIGIRLNSEAFHTVAYLDNIVWDQALSTTELKNDSFTYYPNPVEDVLNLSYDKNITKIAVYNVLGQEMMTSLNNSTQSKLDMSSLASGTYLVKVTVDNTEKTIKVIKQ